MSAIFSPRSTLAVKPEITFASPYDLLMPSISRMCLPDGRFCSKLQYGRWDVGSRQLRYLQALDFFTP